MTRVFGRALFWNQIVIFYETVIRIQHLKHVELTSFKDPRFGPSDPSELNWVTNFG